MIKTIQDVIDTIMKDFEEVQLEDTVDNFKAGNPQWEVTGIVTTFTATIDVIKKAVEIGANLIITHEPTFYDNRDNTDWLKDNYVYEYKKKLIDESKIAIWRFHDYWHSHKPDGIYIGVVKELGWQEYGEQECFYNIPMTTLKGLADFFKNKYGMQAVRVVGNPDMECSRIGLSVGACPGDWQIKFMNETNVDVVVYGEVSEWQTCEYIRDSVAIGLNRGAIIIGHANSEEAGMEYLVDWLKDRISDVPITHIPAGDPIGII